MKRHTCPVCGGEWINPYDALTTKAKIRCMSEYITHVAPYDEYEEPTIEELECDIKRKLEESEQGTLAIDDNGTWYIYGKRY